MAIKFEFYTSRTYSELAKEFDTLAKITPKNLKSGYQLSVGADNYLSFVKPWGFQKAGAWISSASNGYSEKDEKIVAYLKKWFDDVLADDVVNSDSVKEIGWTEQEVKGFEAAFKGLTTLGETYVNTFGPSKEKAPYYAKKMQTAKDILSLASNYNTEFLGEKIGESLDKCGVKEMTDKLNKLISENFSPVEDLIKFDEN